MKRGSADKTSGVRCALAIAAIAAAAIGAGASGSTAQASISPEETAGREVLTYRIPAGSMANALNILADISGLQLLYDAGVTERLRTSGLSGQYSVKEGLDRLLRGTGLSYRIAAKRRTVSIVLAQNDAGTQSDAGAIALPAVDVEGSGSGGGGGAGDGSFGGAGPAQDPYNKTYVLPNATTGTKTNTPIMDTPLNVQVITQQVLQDQQAITIQQALQNVSGVDVAGGGGASHGTPYNQIVLRGFPTFAYYRNGFRLDTGLSPDSELDSISTLQLANVASVEVLKGPAAILYGLSEPGGIINIVTKEPLNAPYYSVQQQIGSFANYRTSMDATGPLTQDGALLYRMDMSYQNNNAPFGSPTDFDYAKNAFIAPVIKWNVDQATWVKLEAQYNETHQNLDYTFAPIYNGEFMTIPRTRNYGGPSPETQNSIFAALTWSHQFDNDWSAKQQLAYYRGNLSENINAPLLIADFGAGPQILSLNQPTTSAQTTFSANTDIIGHINTFGAKHTLLLGGDVYSTQTSVLNLGSPLSLIDIWNPVLPGAPLVPRAWLLFSRRPSTRKQPASICKTRSNCRTISFSWRGRDINISSKPWRRARRSAS